MQSTNLYGPTEANERRIIVCCLGTGRHSGERVLLVRTCSGNFLEVRKNPVESPIIAGGELRPSVILWA